MLHPPTNICFDNPMILAKVHFGGYIVGVYCDMIIASLLLLVQLYLSTGKWRKCR